MSAPSKFVSSTVTHVALNPLVTGTLLWVLTKGPPRARNALINAVSALRSPQTLARATRLLKWLFGLGVVRAINRKLNDLALNAYRINNEKKRWKWNEEIAVVTGGCSGIGLVLVKRLLRKGIKVAILDIQQLPPTLHGYANVSFFSCDISDPSAVASTAEKVRATLGRPSILVNNAGIARPRTILQTSPEKLRQIFDVNVLSNWYTVQAFLPDMIKQNKGHVVTVASMASYVAVAGMIDYAATKAAVLSLHEGLVYETRHKHKAPNVLFTSVHPVWVQTPLLGAFDVGLKGAGTPTLEPEDVADAIAEQIVNCSSGQLCVPGRTSYLTGIRGWPNWMQEYFRGTSADVVLSCTE